MALVDSLLVRLVGDSTSYTKMMDAAVKQAEHAQKSIENISKQVANVGQKAASVGKGLTVGVTAPVIAAGAAAVKSFASFDHAMTESTAIMDVTSKQIEQMRQTALSLSASGKVLQTPREMAEAYFYLASAGLDAQQSMAALPLVANFATAGAFDMARATDLVTDAQSALGLTVKDTEQNMVNMLRVSDTIIKANKLANATAEQYAEAIGNEAGAALKTFSKDVEEGVAVLAAFADQSIKGLEAGSNLSRMTRLLSESALRNAEAHRKLGFSVFDSTGKMRNYADIIENLEKLFSGKSSKEIATIMQQLGFGAESQNAILPLIGTSQRIREYEAQLRMAAGTTQTVAQKQMQSLTNQLKLIRNQLASLSIQFAASLQPLLQSMIDLLKRGVDWWANLDSGTKQMIGTVAVAAAALGPLLIVIGNLVTAVATLAPLITGTGVAILGMINPIVGVVVAAVALAGIARAVLGSWEAVGHFFKEVGILIGDTLVFAVRVATRIWQTFFAWFLERITNVFSVDFLSALMSGLRVAGEAIVEFGKYAIAKLREIFTGSSTGTFDDFMAQYIGYAQQGRNSTDILSTLQGAFGEEYARYQANREGRSFFLPESKMSDQVQSMQGVVGSVAGGANAMSDEMLKVLREISTNTRNDGTDTLQIAPLRLNEL